MMSEYSSHSLEDYLLLFQDTNVQLNGNDSRVNFLNHNYTISDITECKRFLKQTMNKKAGSNVIKNTEFLNKGEKLLTENLMKNGQSNVGSVYVTPVKKDNKINVLEKETYDNVINIDTQYISSNNNALTTKLTNGLTVKLTEPVNNVCELMLNTIQIPYTFNNISTVRQNNSFLIKIHTEQSIIKHQIILDDGYYESITNIIDEINAKLNLNEFLENKLVFVQNPNTKKIYIENNTELKIDIEFIKYNILAKNSLTLYRCLGWILGYRGVERSHEFSDEYYTNELVKLNLRIESNSREIFQGTPLVPNQKYFVLAIDDFTKSQNDKNLISTTQTKLKVESKVYPMDPENMNCISCDNVNDFNGKYTKAEQYTQIELLKEKQMQSTNLNTDSLNVNNVLAIIPFNGNMNGMTYSSMITFDSSFFMKKNRKYFGPIDLTKIKFTLYDDYGNVVDFNESDWNFSLIATSLYKNNL